MVRKAADTKSERKKPIGCFFFFFFFCFLPPFSKASFRKLEQLMAIVKSLPLNTSPEGESYSKCASHMIINHKHQRLLTQSFLVR